MAASKLQLPASLRNASAAGAHAKTDTLEIEGHRSYRSTVEAQAKVESARLDIAGQMLGVIKQGLEVTNSYLRLKNTEAEWQGRVAAAELELRKEELTLTALLEKNASRKEELKQAAETQRRVLGLFDLLMDQAQDAAIQFDDRERLTNQLLELTKSVVALQK